MALAIDPAPRGVLCLLFERRSEHERAVRGLPRKQAPVSTSVVFLAGESRHLVSPMGGFGINIGISSSPIVVRGDTDGPDPATATIIRPDHHVAWRGDRLPSDVDDLLDAITGSQAWAR
jgi:hypothetical protein